MSFLSILFTTIIAPLMLLFEVIFSVANRLIGNPGLSIIILSISINFLVLPLYMRADELQAEEHDIQAKMAGPIAHLKKTFSGDKRFMILQTYYRQNHYKPVYALKSSASLLLQIPFFIAAYRFLSGLQSLKGMSFGPIPDLGNEDALFMIGSFPVNILPILMTLVNIVSGIIYTKGRPARLKVQVYALALFFLVILYHSPSGLAFYWMLNNTFSLVKNIFYKLKKPRKVLKIIFAIAGCALLISSCIRPDLDARQKVLLAIGSFLLMLPFLTGLRKTEKEPKARPKDGVTFFFGTLLMALFTGLLIPCTVINTSTEEFINVLYPANPTQYIEYSLFIALGTWVLWGGVFYFFMSDRNKSYFSEGIWLICGIAIVNFLTAGANLGILSANLQYKVTPAFALSEYLLNALFVIAVALAFHFIFSRFRSITRIILIAGIVAIIPFSAVNLRSIKNTYHSFMDRNASSAEIPVIPLSTDGQNVVVLMLDRAIGPEVPYIFNEKPELAAKFDGFIYYPNTISYGGHTNFASPALFGGYEYTPGRLNRRDTEIMSEKHNEALKVMPVLFGESGYEVTICDPPYAGYSWIPDLTIYDEYPSFHCFNTNAHYNYFEDSISSEDLASRITDFRERNFFCFSLMKIAPVLIQETIYDGGAYNSQGSDPNDSESISNASDLVQKVGDANTTSSGYDVDFLNSYPVLTNLTKITKIDHSSQNTFLMMANSTTHSPALLQEPDYTPAKNVDNTAYDVDMESRYTLNGKTLDMSTTEQVTHYHVNVASYLQLAEWFDYLREMGVYDNTRIILVADHGHNVEHFDMKCHDEDLEYYMPLLMVKDFNAKGFTVSEEFMTNADTPVLATSGLISDPKNPFTGMPIDSTGKEGKQLIISSDCWDVNGNNGTRFLPAYWFVFEGDPYDPECWKYLGID